MLHFIFDAIGIGRQVDVIYTGFDQLDHFIFLQKLVFSHQLLVLLQSYMRGRTNFIRYRGFISETTSGVPQGSDFSPLLFLIFM